MHCNGFVSISKWNSLLLVEYCVSLGCVFVVGLIRFTNKLSPLFDWYRNASSDSGASGAECFRAGCHADSG